MCYLLSTVKAFGYLHNLPPHRTVPNSFPPNGPSAPDVRSWTWHDVKFSLPQLNDIFSLLFESFLDSAPKCHLQIPLQFQPSISFVSLSETYTSHIHHHFTLVIRAGFTRIMLIPVLVIPLLCFILILAVVLVDLVLLWSFFFFLILV